VHRVPSASPVVGARTARLRLPGQGAQRPAVEPARPDRHSGCYTATRCPPSLRSRPAEAFAQALGLTFSSSALLAWGLGNHPVAFVLIGGLVVAATLESVFAICLGCVVFNRLMRWGLIPADVCAECNDITEHFVPARS